MGVHTGDSMTVAPALTLTDKEYQVMRDASLAGCVKSVLILVAPMSSLLFVPHMAGHRNEPAGEPVFCPCIEGDRVSHTKVAAKLAVGFTLDER